MRTIISLDVKKDVRFYCQEKRPVSHTWDPERTGDVTHLRVTEVKMVIDRRGTVISLAYIYGIDSSVRVEFSINFGHNTKFHYNSE